MITYSLELKHQGEALLHVGGWGGSHGWSQLRQCPHQPGHNSTISEHGQRKVWVTGCTDSPTRIKVMYWVQSPSSESKQEIGPEAWLETRLQHRSNVHPGAGARDKIWERHNPSMAVTSRGGLAWPDLKWGPGPTGRGWRVGPGEATHNS